MSAPYLLNPKDMDFPNVDSALQQPNGLLAIGGDLSPERVLAAYRVGIFPWFNQGDPILWWSPDPRMILYPEKFVIPRSLKKVLKQKQFTITEDQHFTELLTLCASIHEQKTGTWLTQAMQQAYCQLHKLGHAHSIEVWHDNELVAGLYGLVIDNVFCGESMVSKISNASKIALAHLVNKNYNFIDCQLPSAHLLRHGAELVSREQFIKLLEQSTAKLP